MADVEKRVRKLDDEMRTWSKEIQDQVISASSQSAPELPRAALATPMVSPGPNCRADAPAARLGGIGNPPNLLHNTEVR